LKGYLLDTNVLSELLKKHPSSAVLERLASIPREELSTSSICIMEMRYGAARHPQGGALWDRVSEEVLPGVRILPLHQEAAERAGDLLAALESRGQTIGLEDVLIGATALAHNLVVATRNVRHFDRIEGLVVESWWEPDTLGGSS
jgi:tRNA(fMet)-specific endonuclease VapC